MESSSWNKNTPFPGDKKNRLLSGAKESTSGMTAWSKSKYMAGLLEHLQNVIHELRNKQSNALLRAASGLTAPNSRLCQLGTKRDTECLEKQQQRDTKMMTFTSPFQPQPLRDSDGSISGY